LSIDIELQRAMEEYVQGRPRVALVALDANTGQIRGLVSKPSFDPNAVLKNWKRLLADPAKPMNDRVTQESFFPGSTYKVVAGMAAIELGKVTPGQTFSCSGSMYFGRKFECHRRHGSTDYKHGYMRSCDVYFYNMGLRVGMDAMARFARDLGYGERPGLELTKEAVGTVPTIAHHKKVSAEGYVRGFDLNTAIGQGEVRVTALQQALAYAAISNGGKLLKPTILEKVVSPDGAVRPAPLVVKRKLHVSERTRRLTHEALTAVMNTPGGTAFPRRSKRMKVGGKTGTAQRRHNIKGKDWERTYEDRDDAWYVSFAPADKPELAVAVLVEHGGHGGSTAAPVAVKISERWFELEGKISPLVAKAPRGTPRRPGDRAKPPATTVTPVGSPQPSPTAAPPPRAPRQQAPPGTPPPRAGVRITSLGPIEGGSKPSAARTDPPPRRNAHRPPGPTP
jgi:penicillin-binding protein 2